MAYEPINSIFRASDVVVLGGGPSLRDFDFNELRGHVVVGCNSAFRLGPEIVQTCLFADMSFFRSERADLLAFHEKGGKVVTACTHLGLHREENRWVKKYPADKWGLSKVRVCFGGNSGCMATSYALLEGAKRVFLLGFDCKMDKDRNQHWHKWQTKFGPQRPEVYGKFLKGWGMIALELPRVFPGAQIINLGPDSEIPHFPKWDWRVALQRAA